MTSKYNTNYCSVARNSRIGVAAIVPFWTYYSIATGNARIPHVAHGPALVAHKKRVHISLPHNTSRAVQCCGQTSRPFLPSILLDVSPYIESRDLVLRLTNSCYTKYCRCVQWLTTHNMLGVFCTKGISHKS